MINISRKTLDDLEFDTVVAQVAAYNITSLGRAEINKLQPFNTKEETTDALKLVHEFVSSFENDNRIPNHGFEDITEELKLLRIENNFLDVEQFRKIAALCLTMQQPVKNPNK